MAPHDYDDVANMLFQNSEFEKKIPICWNYFENLISHEMKEDIFKNSIKLKKL